MPRPPPSEPTQPSPPLAARPTPSPLPALGRPLAGLRPASRTARCRAAARSLRRCRNAADQPVHGSGQRQARAGGHLDPPDPVARRVPLLLREARPPPRQHRDVVPPADQRARDPVGPRIELGRGRQDEDGALRDGPLLLRHEAAAAAAALAPAAVRRRSARVERRGDVATRSPSSRGHGRPRGSAAEGAGVRSSGQIEDRADAAGDVGRIVGTAQHAQRTVRGCRGRPGASPGSRSRPPARPPPGIRTACSASRGSD